MRYLVLFIACLLFFYFAATRVGVASPNPNPPSVIPGPTKCDATNCKRRRVWRKRFFELSSNDRAWLRRTRTCEWNPRQRWRTNTGNSYFGAYQFSASTAWNAGFTMLPHRTWRYEQDVRALRWRNRAGAGQWPICGV